MFASTFTRIGTRMGRLALVIVAAAGLSACGVNTVPTAEENAKAKWADVESAYQRRAALIPNLVATAKGAAASETSWYACSGPARSVDCQPKPTSLSTT